MRNRWYSDIRQINQLQLFVALPNYARATMQFPILVARFATLQRLKHGITHIQHSGPQRIAKPD